RGTDWGTSREALALASPKNAKGSTPNANRRGYFRSAETAKLLAAIRDSCWRECVPHCILKWAGAMRWSSPPRERRGGTAPRHSPGGSFFVAGDWLLVSGHAVAAD